MNTLFERWGQSFRAGRAQHIGNTVLHIKEGPFELPDLRVHGSLTRAEDGTVTMVARRDTRDVHTDTTMRVIPGEFDNSPLEVSARQTECRDGRDPVISVYPPQEGAAVLGLHTLREIADAAYRGQRHQAPVEPVAG